jgi:phage terminase small subunit
MAENGNAEQVTPKQQRYIEALLAGHNHQLAAKVAGVAKRTSDRWLTLPHFKQALRLAQKQVYDQVMAGLALKADKWINRLDFHTDSSETPAAIQVQAAKFLLEQANSHIRSEELEQRVMLLEERLSLL